jgi:NAD(P)H-flavin reductase
MKNVYTPESARISSVKIETRDIKTFKLVFEDENARNSFVFAPGQFVELSAPAAGEATFCIASAPSDRGYIECSVKRVGRVTEAIHMLNPGSIVGIRGPYGNSFPLEAIKEKNVIFVGGGIGLAPLRSLIREVLARRNDFAEIKIIYGARAVRDLVYKDDLDEWQTRDDINTILTVDPGGETPDWKGKVGFVPAILKEIAPAAAGSVVITCGPPIMIKFTLAALNGLGFQPGQIITTLEMKMKCGVGKCGRCNIGPLYVCKDGPVFTCEQIKNFIEDVF